MIVEKGQYLQVNHCRMGTMVVETIERFDTETVVFFPVILVDGSRAHTIQTGYAVGARVPCRGSLVRGVEIVKWDRGAWISENKETR